MRDPYLYQDTPVLKNLLGIKIQQDLQMAMIFRRKSIWSVSCMTRLAKMNDNV